VEIKKVSDDSSQQQVNRACLDGDENSESNEAVKRKRTPFSRRKNNSKNTGQSQNQKKGEENANYVHSNSVSESTDNNNNNNNTNNTNTNTNTNDSSNHQSSSQTNTNNNTKETSISNQSSAEKSPAVPTLPYNFPDPSYKMEPIAGNFFVSDYKHYDGQLIPSFAKTKRGNKIACTYIKYTNNPDLHRKKPSKFVILFSHGNAVDIGQMPPFYTALARALQTDIMSYDYSGYGESSGSPSEANIYADAKAAFNHLQDIYKFKPEQIIIYGQSIGSVATLDLAARKIAQNCPAIVLHSPLLSGIKVIHPNQSRKYCIDPFPSYEKIKNVKPKVLVIHGTEDEVINFSHGLQMYELAVNKFEPLWVEGAGHNDIEHYPVYAQRLKRLIRELVEKGGSGL